MPVATHELVHKLRWALDAADEDRNLTLGTALHGVHPADIADALQQLSRSEALAVFNWLDDARAAEVLDELEHDLKQYMLRQAPARASQRPARLPA